MDALEVVFPSTLSVFWHIKHLKEENEFELYRNLANNYNLSTKEVLIVDDSKRLIKKAKKFGLKLGIVTADSLVSTTLTLKILILALLQK